MQFRHIATPATLFAAIGIPVSAHAATTINVNYDATTGAGTQITIGAAAAPQFNFNIQPGAVGGTKSYLNANFANDPTARIGFPGSTAIYTTANTSTAGTSNDFATNGNYNLIFSIGNTLYSGFATVDNGGRHISSITYDLADAAAVPEPATWAMTILGMGAVGAAARRRRRQVGAAVTA